MRRTQMPRRAVPLLRTATLAQGSPLARTTPLQRSPRLAVVSSDGAAVHPIRRQQRKDTGPAQAVRQLVLERDGFACVCCGVSIGGRPYSLQHRKRRSHGRDNSPSNLITVLGTGTTGCHERIDSRRDQADELKGYTVRSWDNPALIAVWLYTGDRVWLTSDGQYSPEPPVEVA